MATRWRKPPSARTPSQTSPNPPRPMGTSASIRKTPTRSGRRNRPPGTPPVRSGPAATGKRRNVGVRRDRRGLHSGVRLSQIDGRVKGRRSPVEEGLHLLMQAFILTAAGADERRPLVLGAVHRREHDLANADGLRTLIRRMILRRVLCHDRSPCPRRIPAPSGGTCARSDGGTAGERLLLPSMSFVPGSGLEGWARVSQGGRRFAWCRELARDASASECAGAPE